MLASLLLPILLQVTGIHTVVSAVGVELTVATLLVSVGFSTWSLCCCSPAVAFVCAVAGRPCKSVTGVLAVAGVPAVAVFSAAVGVHTVSEFPTVSAWRSVFLLLLPP